jgi:putative N6-adenine-specific DNA methylase
LCLVQRRLNIFATASRGTEDLLAAELAELGARRIRQDRGGVRFLASLEEALRVCLWTRIAMRVLFPLGRFEAGSADEIYAAASQIAWEEHLTTLSTFAVEATLRNSEHRHSGFVALKIKDAIADRLRSALGARPNVDPKSPRVRVVAHLAKRALSLSLDLAGAPLNQRGYRARQIAAPLKETLAAAILRAVGYDGNEVLVDPLCGSGTFLVEAAMIARHRAPARRRRFAVEAWPALADEATRILADLRADAERSERQAPCAILGFDKEGKESEAAKANAKAADVAKAVRVARADATALPGLGVGPGLLVSNPPYGNRLAGGGQQAMKSFYHRLGESFARLHGWRLALLAGNPAFESAFHMRPVRRRRLWNGPIECQLFEYDVRPAARKLKPKS